MVAGLEPDRVGVAFRFEISVQFGAREGRVTSEELGYRQGPVLLHDGVQRRLPCIRTMHVSVPQPRPQQVPELVGAEQRMVAGVAEVPVVGGAFLPAVRRAA